jgi:hypothetical protein
VLRLAFWSLLILNAAVYGYAQGYLGNGRTAEHEPERLERQFNTAKLTLLAQDGTKAGKPGKAARPAPAPEAQVAATPAPAPVPAPAPAGVTPAVACTEAGPFTESDARRFETRIAPLDLGPRLSRQEVQSQDVTSWIVNIPPQPTREAAERKAAELRELGVSDFYILPADSALKFAISLGMFKTEAGAQTMLANLNKQGVHTARITPRGPLTTHVVYRLRNLDAPTHERVAAIALRLDEAGVRSCGAAR